jgi:predicted permease
VVENWRITPAVQPLKDEVIGGVGDMLWILMATIGIVLLIACANVANLMLVRSESRRQEFALRAALGAGRGHIAREVLVESLVLSLVGGALGAALAYAALSVIVATAPATLPRVEDISLDPRVMTFAVVVSLFSSLLFGALPALKHAVQHGGPLGGATRGASASRDRQRTRNSLVVVQVALALVLLVGSGLMIRTFQALLNVTPGFAATADVQTARIWVPPQQVPNPERALRIQHEILDKVAALPGVTAAAFASAVPMEGPIRVWTQPVDADAHSGTGTMPPMRRMKLVSPGYFNAIGTRMIVGRDITWNDIYGRARVAIVSENFARELWGSPAAALGQRIRESPQTPVWRDIVGVVENVHEDAVHEPAPAMAYWPVMMEQFNGAPLFVMRPVNLVIRSDQAGRESLLGGIRNAVSSVNSTMPVFLVRTMKDLRRDRIRGGTTLARDRHPPRAWRRAGRAHADVRAAGARPHRGRRGGGSGDGVRVDTLDVVPSVRRRAARPADVCRRARSVRYGGGAGQLCTSSPGGSRRSGGNTDSGVNSDRTS